MNAIIKQLQVIMKAYAEKPYADEDLIDAYNRLMDKLNQTNLEAITIEMNHIGDLED
jgi:hypothetical protein